VYACSFFIFITAINLTEFLNALVVGVFASMAGDTPLRPSHPDSYREGNRTGHAFKKPFPSLKTKHAILFNAQFTFICLKSPLFHGL
jgi:hypothetical protein